MKSLYLDIFSGISGDMFIGAMLDLGVSLDDLKCEIAKLGLGASELQAERQQRSSISGFKFDVLLPDGSKAENQPNPVAKERTHSHGHSHSHSHSHQAHSHESEQRDFRTIKALIQQSTVSDWVKEKSIAVFSRVAVAEGKVHGMPAENVHFHEVGAIDSIIDIVGACVCLEALGMPDVHAAEVTEGHGWVDCAHGRFPIPTAATLEILSARGIPISQCEEPHELITPTGAALLAEFSKTFGPMTQLSPEKIGYGLGTRENKTRPNVLRAILGTTTVSKESQNDWEMDRIMSIEANIDDATGEQLGHVMELAMEKGALDVFATPIQMKKNRPATLLSLLCDQERADEFSEWLLRETTTFGIRRQVWDRRKLQRKFEKVATSHGEITIKLGILNGETVHATPEFESCRAAAASHCVSFAKVYAAAQVAGRTIQ